MDISLVHSFMHSFIHWLIPSVIHSTFIFLSFYNQPSTGQVNKDPYVKEAWLLPEGASASEGTGLQQTHSLVCWRQGERRLCGHQGAPGAGGCASRSEKNKGEVARSESEGVRLRATDSAAGGVARVGPRIARGCLLPDFWHINMPSA